MLFAIEEAEGDEFMAVKPWKGAMHAPSDRKVLFFYSIFFIDP